MAAGAAALSEIKRRQRDRGNGSHGTRRVQVWRVTLDGGLPGCGSWVTAASAVEQKPHEGSVLRHKNKHAGTQP